MVENLVKVIVPCRRRYFPPIYASVWFLTNGVGFHKKQGMAK